MDEIEKDLRHYKKIRREIINHERSFDKDTLPRVERVIQAYEKLVPRKVKEIHIDEYFCPTCGSENNCNDGKIEDNYCPNCGQKIDWSDEQ